MLARVAEMRASGRVRSTVGAGVLVKAPKRGQDRALRSAFDRPAHGRERGAAPDLPASRSPPAAASWPSRSVSSPPPTAPRFSSSACRPGPDAADERRMSFWWRGRNPATCLGAALIAALKAATDGGVRFSGVGGAQMAAQGLASLYPLGDLAIIGFAAIPARLPTIVKRIRADRRRGDRRAAGRAGDHRQSRFHPPGGAPRARTRAAHPDRRLCLSLGLGLAAGPRQGHARLRRSGAGAAAVRARRRCAGSTGRRRPMSVIRCWSRLDALRPNAGGGGAPAGRPAAVAGAAGQPFGRNQAHGGDLRGGGRRGGRARRPAGGGGAGGARGSPRRCAARSPPGRCRPAWSPTGPRSRPPSARRGRR